MTETLTAPEQLTAPRSFVELAETVIDNPDEAIIDDALEDWRENPGEHIKNQVEELAELYKARVDREIYQWSNSIESVDSFATRDADGQNIEEIYHIFDEFSASNKQWKKRRYGVTMLRPDGKSTTLVVEPDMTIKGYQTGDNGKLELLYGEAKDDAVVDFFSRSLVATVRSCKRSEEEKAIADTDAKQKLENLLYDGPKVVSSID